MVNKRLLAIVVAGLFALGFTGYATLGALPNVHASSSTTTLDQWCISMGLSYDYTTSTCTVTSTTFLPYNVEITSGQTLNITTGQVAINTGVTLTVDSGGVVSLDNTCSPSCDQAMGIDNSGNITNSGTINVKLSGTCVDVSIGGCFGISNTGNVTNRGTINLDSTMTCDSNTVCVGILQNPNNVAGSSFFNYGALNVEDTLSCSTTLPCYGIFNGGQFFNECGGTIMIAGTDTFENQGTMTNSGTITGTITGTQPVSGSGCTVTSYTVSGPLDQALCQNNGATWDYNTGVCTIPPSVEWDVAAYGELFINSPVINNGAIHNALKGEIYLTYTSIDNTGTIDNYGLIQSDSSVITGNAVNNIQNGLSGGYVIDIYYPDGPLASGLCQTNGGSWNGTGSSCTIPTTVEWMVAGLIGNSLTIQQYQTLVINQSVFDGVGMDSGLNSNAGTITNHGYLNDKGFLISFEVSGASLPVFDNYGTINITSYGQFDNQGILTNEYGATITNYGAISNVVLTNNSGSISNIGIHSVFYEFCGSVLTGNSVGGITYVGGCQPTAQGSSTTTISSGGASSGPISNTGVSVTISGSTAQGSTSVTMNAEDLTSQESGVLVSGLGSPTYYDVKIFGITDGNAQICIASSPSSGLTMQYWDGSTWVSASSITTTGNEVCGVIPVSALTGTNLAIGQPLNVVTPQFPFGTILAVLVPIAALALFAGERRFRGPAPSRYAT